MLFGKCIPTTQWIENSLIHLRGATLSGEWSRALIEDFYMPEYNVVSWSGMLVPPSLFKNPSLDS